jgi:hypothetical protein
MHASVLVARVVVFADCSADVYHQRVQRRASTRDSFIGGSAANGGSKSALEQISRRGRENYPRECGPNNTHGSIVYEHEGVWLLS